jgi:8-oxo-dGTP diphosphatase
MIQTLEPQVGTEVSGVYAAPASLASTPGQHPEHRARPDGKQRPRVGCAGLIRRGKKVLLGKRNKEPNRGLWVLPGGGVEFCETFEQTLERELLEEAGISIAVRETFRTYQLINPPNEHRVIIYLIADYRSGEPIPSSDLSDVRFFDSDELRDLSKRKLISSFVEKVLREANLL